jgi:thiosulfate/3-mercaptopyruvate sulfurtransferase
MSALISAKELKDRLSEPGVKVFDIRGRWGDPPVALKEEYEKGHVPGAVYLDWIQTFLQPGLPIPEAPVVRKEGAARAFRDLGICRGDTVVLYDDYSHLFACRVWWSMKYWGFPDVRILDGGWQNWEDAYEISTVEDEPTLGDFEPEATPSWLVETAQVVQSKDQCLLLDGRGEAGFQQSRIPGSISLPWHTLFDAETGHFKERNALEEVFDSKGDWRSKPVISTCGAGYTASVVLFALSELGKDVPLYDGSLTIWKKEGHPVD